MAARLPPATGSGEDLIHLSDHGCQDTSLRLGALSGGGYPPLRRVGWVGGCYDKAMAERCLAMLECELLARQPDGTQIEARTALCTCLEVF